MGGIAGDQRLRSWAVLAYLRQCVWQLGFCLYRSWQSGRHSANLVFAVHPIVDRTGGRHVRRRQWHCFHIGDTMLDTLKHPPIPNLCDGTCTDSCPLDAVNDMVRGIIQGARASAPVVKTGACIHRGKKIGETTCVECSAKGWRLNVLECSIHQTCTIENKGDRVAAGCRTCPDYAPVAIEPIKHNEGRHRFELGNGRSTLVDAYQNGAIPIARQQNIPYERPIVRNLAYHIAPFSCNGTWQRNVAQIRQRMSLLNG